MSVYGADVRVIWRDETTWIIMSVAEAILRSDGSHER